ncbi:MAG: ABC transporter ATP-binding protein [Microbacterium sp.]|uniref:ABC transporter ATP-binding protein n=1 Tax=Microbacterium sp. TaxID=51671 RepID=UPI0039E39BBE
MSAPLPGPPDRSSPHETPDPASPAGEALTPARPRRRTLLPHRPRRNPLRQSPAQVPDDLVIPPRPPLPPVVPPQPEQPEDAVLDADEPELELEPEPELEPEAELEPEPLPEPEAEPGSSAPALDVLWDDAAPSSDTSALVIEGVSKRFGDTVAVAELTLTVEPGTFFGLVGPNGAGKTTTLSMIAGLLRADDGSIRVRGVDVRAHEREAKSLIGVLPDRLRTFDRLTGRQLLSYAGLLRGLSGAIVDDRVAALAAALDLEEALGRVVSDYSAGMTKKLMLAAAMIHAPRLLVLDEPFEAVDPASSVVILDILRSYVAAGGAVVLSSHGMELVERVCDRVAVIAGGRLLVEGAVDDIRGDGTLEERYLELVGAAGGGEGLEWLRTFSD